jgi:hypothetical protein
MREQSLHQSSTYITRLMDVKSLVKVKMYWSAIGQL